ncbi:MAG: FAD-binding protein [Cyanobacteria bacterium]|nr:FAD-binding protein [Cyanobacteriota bacterium]
MNETTESSLISELVSIVGEENVLCEPEDLMVYECDAETLDVSMPDLVVLPGSTGEVAGVMKVASRHRVPVSPRGAGTGLSGGSTAISGGISLVLTRMTRVLKVDAFDRIAVAEVGATNLSISRAAHDVGLYFAPDPSSQSASTIGGNIAENAGGPHCLKYGMTVSHVLGATVVLYNGETISLGGKTRDYLSLDLLGVMVGSEGTLGIVTEATLRLIPLSQALETIMAYFPTVGDCGQAVSDIIAHGVIPAAMEMIDNLTLNAVEDYLAMGLNREAGALLIVELDGPRAGIEVHREIVEQCLSQNNMISFSRAHDAEERARIWKARKHSFGALGRITPNGYVLDGVIPRSKLAESIEHIAKIGLKHDLRIANVYHAGDGNLHPCLLYDRDNLEQIRRVVAAGREILELCVELGGTLSGEHGIGIEKILEMPLVFNESDLEAMRWVKIAFDPDEMMNPSKVLPTPKSCGESGRSLLRHQLMASC